MKVTLVESVEFPVTIDAEFIYLQSAAEMVTVRFESTGRTVNLFEGAVYRVAGALPKMFLKGSGAIELQYGYGFFTPPIDGQTVKISDIPAMEIAAGQSIEVSQAAPMEIAAGQSIEVSQAAPMEIAAGQSIEVSQAAPMEIAAGQSIEVSQAAPMEIAAGQSVEVSQAAPMEIAAGQSVEVVKSDLFNALLVDTFPHTQAQNTDRKTLIIRAGADNVAAVILGGAYELAAGEFVELNTTAAVLMDATAGDVVQLIEV